MSFPLLRRFDQAIGSIACTLLLALLFVVTAGIVSRALGEPFIWTDEAASYLMVWVSMFGWMVATRRAAHIRIRFFNNMLPGLPRRLLETVFLGVAAGIGLLIAYQGVHLWKVNSDVPTITLGFATSWLYAPVIPAGLVTFGQAMLDLYDVWRSGPEAHLERIEP
ncbi:MAG: TRAP transporter small permease [Rhabdaerophilum sp.]